MFLTTVASALTLGAGVKLYRERKRKKERPWRVAAERMKRNQRHKGGILRVSAPSTLGLRADSEKSQGIFLRSGKMVKQLVSDISSALSSQERYQQQQAISASDDPVNALDRKINRNLKISFGFTGLTAFGVIFYPPLSLVGVAGVVYLWCLPLFKRVYQNIKARRVTTDVADIIMITGTFVSGYIFLSTVMTVVSNLFWKLLVKTEDHSREQLSSLFAQQPRQVWVVQNGVEVQIPFEEVQAGDVVVVNAGEIIPVDGSIHNGLATIDQRLLTGEAQPVEKGPSDTVFAATALLAGRITLIVKEAGTATVAAQIGEILTDTQSYKDELQARGQKIANQFVLPTLLLTACTWPLLGPVSGMTLLCSPVGYNMRLLGPFSVLNFLLILSRQGVLIKDGRALEALQQVDTIVFDKTGTLTLEQPQVGQLMPFNGLDEEALLTYAATAEYRQPHPIARAILAAAEERGLHLPPIDEATYQVGYGIKVNVAEKLIRVGSARFLSQEGITLPDEIKEMQAKVTAQGFSLVYVAVDEQFGGAIKLVPVIRPEAKAIIRHLRQRNMDLYIISGDHEQPTRRLAHSLGIEHYFAETLPENTALRVPLGESRFGGAIARRGKICLLYRRWDQRRHRPQEGECEYLPAWCL